MSWRGGVFVSFQVVGKPTVGDGVGCGFVRFECIAHSVGSWVLNGVGCRGSQVCGGVVSWPHSRVQGGVGPSCEAFCGNPMGRGLGDAVPGSRGPWLPG